MTVRGKLSAADTSAQSDVVPARKQGKCTPRFLTHFVQGRLRSHRTLRRLQARQFRTLQGAVAMAPRLKSMTDYRGSRNSGERIEKQETWEKSTDPWAPLPQIAEALTFSRASKESESSLGLSVVSP